MADHTPAYDHNTEGDDSEWEYEYHETETESFYVTLDLSTATKSYRPGKQKDPNEPKSAAGATASRANNSSTPNTDAPSAATQQDGENVGAPNFTTQQAEANPDASNDTTQQDGENADETEPASEPPDRIQILDLHSPNPIISYQNQIYSCEWTSTIGTDVLLTAPDPDFPHPVIKEEPGVSVLAMTSVKLFGKPAQIASRESKEAAPEEATPVKIPVNIATKKARQNQAKFLERLIAIKAAKGEKDDVTVYAQKGNQGSNRRSQQQEGRASEDADANINLGDESVPITPTVVRASTRARGRGSRSRGSNSRKSGPRTKRGGLFKDYTPQPSPTESADIRFQPSATPFSWDQLDPSLTGHDNNSIVQPTTATPAFSTPPSVPTPGYRPPASHPNIDPQSTDHTSIDTAPNVPPDPDEASKNPGVDPMHSSTPLTAESGCEQRASAIGRGSGGPSPVGGEGRSSARVDDGGDGDGDGGGGLVGAVERNSGSDVEMGDG